ncbi:MAG: polyprenyl synthetase, partial [Methanobacteriota archaeon]
MNFTPYVEKIRPRLDARIAELLRPVAFNTETTEMILRGKRLRGGLLLVVHEALTASEADDVAVDLAAAIELAHAASLILDDVIDEDEERRGVPALHMTFGQKQAILEAVGVLSIPYRVVAPHGNAYVRHLAETQVRMASGASVEVASSTHPSASELYDAIITRKTAELFGLAAFWGANSAAHGDDCFRQFGVHCGRILQIADDAADLYAFLAGTRQQLTGSELLLLRAVTADRSEGDTEHSGDDPRRIS